MEFSAPITQGIQLVPMSCPNLDTYYTHTFVITHQRYFGCELQFSSDTDVNVKVELEQGNVKPDVQGSYSPNFVVATDLIDNITDENVHLYPITPVVAVYGRIKVTGLNNSDGVNSATTVLNRALWVEVQS
jgi:hypothetical protein